MASKAFLLRFFFFFFFLLPLILSILPPVATGSQTTQEQTSILFQIKNEFGNPPSLQSWNISSTAPICNWTGIQCTGSSITSLSLPNLNLQTKPNIPVSLCNLISLSFLDLSFNHIPGPFNPLLFFNCTNLQSLDLSHNSFSGEIPDSVSQLKSLTALNLSGNHLSGEIPAGIASLPHLTTLDLSDNQLNGSIPAELGDNLSNKLNFLNLSSNLLSGEIPAQLQIPAYDRSFLSNPNLCSSMFFLNLRSCTLQQSSAGSTSSTSSNNNKTISPKLLILIVGLVVVLVFVFILGLLLLATRIYKRRDISSQDPKKIWKLTSFHSLEFRESDILNETTEDNLIGRGGGGLVYRVGLPSQDIVAVKKIWNNRKLDAQLEKEFNAEVAILSEVRHEHVVKLLGCISSSDSKLLVYEYMVNGSLDRWLHLRHRADGPPLVGVVGSGYMTLDWPRRLEIALGAAKGLCYMHHGFSKPIVHRDIKSSNILLDSELNAKISDFGLARMLMKHGEPESVSVIAGSFGYMAPECGWSKRVNEKLDVYSFGVVLLELTTGRESKDDNSCLADWVQKHFKEGGNLIDIIDMEIPEPSRNIVEIDTVLTLGMSCTATIPESRPTMEAVLQVLQQYNHRMLTIEE